MSFQDVGKRKPATGQMALSSASAAAPKPAAHNNHDHGEGFRQVSDGILQLQVSDWRGKPWTG